VTGRDWHEWHTAYDDPDSALARRLATVRQQVRTALDGAPAGPLRALSMVAGQGRDLIPVLASHPRGRDVTARLVELDPRNTALAREAVAAAGLSQVEVITGDAALIDHYADIAPADLVLICGLFGNITEADIATVISHVPELTRRGGTVIWTRHRHDPDLVPQIDAWFAEQGCHAVFISERGVGFGVGAHRFDGDPVPPRRGTKLFEFVGFRDLRGRTAAS
jgi:hypothetical protein